MVSSKVSCRVQMFPVSSVRNRRRNLGNFRRNTAPDAGFGGFLSGNSFRVGNMEVSSMFPVRVPESKGGPL